MTRANKILIIILFMQVLLALYMFQPWSKGSETPAENLFAGIGAEEISEIAIKGEKETAIQIQKTGDKWILPGCGGYPADQAKVSLLAEKITGLATRPLVARKKSSHKRLKVSADAFERLITFKAGDKKEDHTLYLGTAPSYKQMHVRSGAGDEVYLARDISVWEADIEPSSWIDTLYFSVKEADVVGLSVKNAQGTIDLERGDQNEWIAKGIKPEEKLDVTQIKGMIAKAVSIRMDEPIGQEESPSFGMESPSAVLTIRTEVTPGKQSDDKTKVEKTHTILVGARDEKEKGYIVKSSGSPFYVYVPSYAVEPFVEKKLADLMETAQEPEAKIQDPE
ncbi:MAG: DUF4340 domain-containing protein [Desulfobacteria bacterium]